MGPLILVVSKRRLRGAGELVRPIIGSIALLVAPPNCLSAAMSAVISSC